MIWPAAIARKIAASTKEGKLLALVGDIAMQDEVGKQGLQAYGAEAGHLPVSVVQAEVAEQAEVKGWLRPLYSFYRILVTASCSSTSTASSWRVVCLWTKLISFSKMRRRIATEFAYVESIPKYERLPAPRFLPLV